MVESNTFKLRRTVSPFNANETGQRWGNVGGTAAPVGGAIDLPGPAVGNIRVYGAVLFTGSAPGVTVGPFTVTLNPSGLPIIAPGAAGNQTFALTALGPGEFIRITNGHATNPASIQTSYIDIANQDGALTLVRLLFGTTPAIAIPTPPSGFFSRWIVGYQNTSLQTVMALFNRDTIAHTAEQLLAGRSVGRTVTASANVQVGIASPPWIRVTPAVGPMTVRANEAITTNQLFLYGVYETIPDTQPIDGQ